MTEWGQDFLSLPPGSSGFLPDYGGQHLPTRTRPQAFGQERYPDNAPQETKPLDQRMEAVTATEDMDMEHSELRPWANLVKISVTLVGS